jgi:hypothetical protein
VHAAHPRNRRAQEEEAHRGCGEAPPRLRLRVRQLRRDRLAHRPFADRMATIRTTSPSSRSASPTRGHDPPRWRGGSVLELRLVESLGTSATGMGVPWGYGLT